MPLGDGTGPWGTGAAGRGLGPCGRGLDAGGAGRRGLRRFGWGPWGQVAPAEPERELGWLRRQAELLRGRLDNITRRLSELDRPDK